MNTRHGNVIRERGKEDRLLPDKMSKEDHLGQMATAHIKPDCRLQITETSNISGEMMDRPHCKKRSSRRLCCGSRVGAWGKKEKGTPKDNMATDGGGRKKRGRMELVEHSTPRGFRPRHVEGKCSCFMCILARRELRLR